jgi:hypothetical protein
MPVDLSHITHPDKISRVSGRLAPDTAIDHMGLSKSAVKLLTPAAAKLTKADLTLLEGSNQAGTAAKLGLSVADITSIKEAFATPVHFGGVGAKVGGPAGLQISVSCCCCSPCCCAAAAMEPVSKMA